MDNVRHRILSTRDGDLLRRLDPERREAVLQAFRTKRFKQGEALVRQGEPIQEVFLVLEGAVLPVIEGAQGATAILPGPPLQPGAWVGISACSGPATAELTLLAASPVAVAACNRTTFCQAVLASPDGALALLEQLTREQRDVLRKLLDLWRGE